jgi:tetratricopeptide (TPR) repeat protein
LFYEEGREDQGNTLSKLYQSKALGLKQRNRLVEAEKYLNKSIYLLKWLVDQQGRKELQEFLARAYLYQADIYREMSDFYTTLQLYNPAIEILKHLIYQENRKNLLEDYANALSYRAEALKMTGSVKEAREDVREILMLIQPGRKNAKQPDLSQVVARVHNLFKAE